MRTTSRLAGGLLGLAIICLILLQGCNSSSDGCVLVLSAALTPPLRKGVAGGFRLNPGRVVVRSSGSFNITTKEHTVQGIDYRYCTRLQRGDGWEYERDYPSPLAFRTSRADAEITSEI